MGNIYIGDSSSKARELKNCYVGVNGVSRKVKAIYVGVGDKARLVWQALKKKIMSYNGSKKIGSYTDSIYHIGEEAFYKVNDNHVLVGLYSDYYSGLRRSILMNLHLDNNGAVTSGTRFETSCESSSSYQSAFNSISQFNDTYGASLTSVYCNSGGAYNARYLCAFNLNSSTTYTDKYTVESGTLDYWLPIVRLNNSCVLLPDYNDNGYVYANIYQCNDSGKIYSKYSGCVTTNLPGGKDLINGVKPCVFALSGNRFAVLFSVQQRYSADTDENKNIMISVFSYSFDSSNNMTVTRVSYSLLPFRSYYGHVESVGDDYFIWTGYNECIGFRIDTSSNVYATNAVSSTGHSAVRIGTSDSALTYFGENGNIIYYDKQNNTISKTWSGATPYTSINGQVPYKEDSVLYAIGDYTYEVSLNKMSFG